ncbi:enoyl-CoA hydratase [Pavlovales sp. CCMP2436]|nr:enoyl-CoA hydratase [Pavlovales sp. CCMP2436]|mmetsp:Transcript_31271/g.78222  ORF Transcript_31271/g.78222 Transcript_31271/m.78222 type:complete len:286 (-) Transcript_31271:119-976(-)
MGESAGPAVLVDVGADDVAWITLNRPASMNALSAEIVAGLLDAVDAISQSRARVVVLTAAGPVFCPGGSLTDGGASSGFSDGGVLPLETAIRKLRFSMTVAQRLHEMPQVTICMINGGCAGAGLSLACACDLRYAVASSKFSTAFVNVGLSGDFGYSYLLPRIVGPAKAREICFTGSKFGADEALSMGLVSSVERDLPALRARVAALTAKLAGGAPLALLAMKRNLLESERQSLSEALDAEAARHAQCGAHPDAAEAGLAFLEKRRPAFSADSLRALQPWERARL